MKKYTSSLIGTLSVLLLNLPAAASLNINPDVTPTVWGQNDRGNISALSSEKATSADNSSTSSCALNPGADESATSSPESIPHQELALDTGEAVTAGVLGAAIIGAAVIASNNHHRETRTVIIEHEAPPPPPRTVVIERVPPPPPAPPHRRVITVGHRGAQHDGNHHHRQGGRKR